MYSAHCSENYILKVFSALDVQKVYCKFLNDLASWSLCQKRGCTFRNSNTTRAKCHLRIYSSSDDDDEDIIHTTNLHWQEVFTLHCATKDPSHFNLSRCVKKLLQCAGIEIDMECFCHIDLNIIIFKNLPNRASDSETIWLQSKYKKTLRHLCFEIACTRKHILA